MDMNAAGDRIVVGAYTPTEPLHTLGMVLVGHGANLMGVLTLVGM